MFVTKLAKLMGKHVGGVSMAKLLRRLEDCKIPADHEKITEILEIIDEKLEFDGKTSGMELIELRGIPLIYRIMSEMKTDAAVTYCCVSIISRLEKVPELMLEMVQLGGIRLMEEIEMIHIQNSFLKHVIPGIISLAKSIGIKQAVVEIHSESQSLEFCTHCQEIAQHNKDREMGVDVGKRLKSHNNFKMAIVPKGCERINKATYFMKEYPTTDTVQITGLDAIIIFARSGDAREAIADTVAIEAAGNALFNFPANDKIVWRVALLFSLLAKLRQQYAMDIIRENSHDILAKNFPLYRISPYVQQSILWMINNICLWPRSRHEIQRNEPCMTLLNSLDYRPGQEREAKMNTMKGAVPQFDSVSAIYQIIIPLKIREFMRETEGQMLVVAKKIDIDSDKAKELLRKRQKLQKNPRYGTVDTHMFLPGEGGLNDAEPAKYTDGGGVVAPGMLALQVTGAVKAKSSPKKSLNQEGW